MPRSSALLPRAGRIHRFTNDYAISHYHQGVQWRHECYTRSWCERYRQPPTHTRYQCTVCQAESRAGRAGRSVPTAISKRKPTPQSARTYATREQPPPEDTCLPTVIQRCPSSSSSLATEHCDHVPAPRFEGTSHPRALGQVGPRAEDGSALTRAQHDEDQPNALLHNTQGHAHSTEPESYAAIDHTRRPPTRRKVAETGISLHAASACP